MSTAVIEQPQARPTETQAAVPTSLSALLREGAKRHPQAYGALYKNGATCALGAIGVALAGEPVTDIGWLRAKIMMHTGINLNALIAVPGGTGFGLGHLYNVVIYLNDSRHWTREAIADWLEAHGF